VNGAVLPATIQAANPKVDVLSDVYTFNADHTYSEVTSFRLTNGTSITTQQATEVGTWSQTNASVGFGPTTSGSSPYTGSVAAGTLTVASGGITAVYTK
jgi:hypothetical protein